MPASLTPPPDSRFHGLLTDQVGNELSAQQQYIALAVWADAQDLRRLATHFYRQAVEERNHAMMIIQYLLDRNVHVVVPGVGSVLNDFQTPRDLIALSLDQEQAVTDQIEQLSRVAREEGDFLGEQFMLWFLREQVEEVASMATLLTITDRAGTDYWQIEDFLARETLGDGGQSDGAPNAAGGAL